MEILENCNVGGVLSVNGPGSFGESISIEQSVNVGNMISLQSDFTSGGSMSCCGKMVGLSGMSCTGLLKCDTQCVSESLTSDGQTFVRGDAEFQNDINVSGQVNSPRFCGTVASVNDFVFVGQTVSVAGPCQSDSISVYDAMIVPRAAIGNVRSDLVLDGLINAEQSMLIRGNILVENYGIFGSISTSGLFGDYIMEGNVVVGGSCSVQSMGEELCRFWK
jgi:hypothetical protein